MRAQAMLLAAGLGTRLHPLTADRAKPAVPFLGRPLIAGLVDLLAAHGFERAVVNTHHLPESVRDALEGAPIEIAFSHEEQILGTAGCLEKAVREGLLERDRDTLIINAKLYTDIDLSAVMRAHRSSDAAVTMVLKPNLAREAFKEVLVEGDRVIGFGRSRVPEGPSPLLFTGIHAITPEVLASIPRGVSDTIADVYPPLIAAKRVLAYVDLAGRWWEFSTLERYLELHARAADEGLGPRVTVSKGAVVEPGAVIDRSVVWEEARIAKGAVVSDAVIGRDVQIRAGERIERAAVVKIDGLRVSVPIPLDSKPGRRNHAGALRMKLRYAGLTHVGMKRTHNEDNLALLPEESLYIVADGMGGHASGEVASQMAVETITSFFRMTTRDEEVTWPFKEEKNLRYDENRLVAAIKFSNQRIYEAAAREARFKGMGTTIVTAFFTQGGAYLGHVGDSRGYRIRESEIEQITDDHSLLNDYIKANKLTPEEIENFPHKNVIVRALGMKDTVQVDVNRLDPKVGDYYLLCSDGLSGMISDEEIRDITLQSGDLESACESLVNAANAAGGTDNITVTIVQFMGD